MYQASGEAQYVDSLPVLPGQLFAQYVLSTVGNATIEKIDASEALVSNFIFLMTHSQVFVICFV